MNRNEDAFSLPDLMAALAIAGVALTSSAPSLASWNSRNLRTDASGAGGFIDAFFMASLQSGRTFDILIGPREMRASGGDGSETAFPRFVLSGSARFDPLDIGRRIRLSPSGSASPQKIWLIAGKKSCALFVSLRGRTRIECGK